MTRNKWPLAIAASAFTTALIGGVALAGFQRPAGDGAAVGAMPSVTDPLVSRDAPKAKLQTVLAGLVTKGTITQAQADAILQAVKDAEPTPAPKAVRPTGPSAMSFIGDLTKAASDYLGMDIKALSTQLRAGKSVADVANGLGDGRNAQGLIGILTNAANGKVDQAVSANKLTADQAVTLKAKIATEITSFVNRSFTKPVLPRPQTPVKPTPSPKS